MPIAEIIAEIDKYLARLRQARELLSGHRAESSPKRVPPSNGKLANRQAGPYSSSRRRGDEHKSRSEQAVAPLKRAMKRVDVSVPVPSAPVPAAENKHASGSNHPPMTQPERAKIEQSNVATRVPSRWRSSKVRSVSHRTPKAVLGTKLDAIKPAIALAGSVGTKIVVVSAEQMRREREQAVPSEVRRPRKVTSGLSGRRAFEALFPD
jgi:hypothetical protein